MNIKKKENTIIPINYSELWENIPNEIRELLYFTNENPPENLDKIGISLSFSVNDGLKMGKLGTSHDPSTIYFPLPITVPINYDQVLPPPRYPKYYRLTPEQKFIYLNWLKDIDRPIHEGYKQLFFFALERQLIIGNFDIAWDTILRLNKNTSKYEFLSFQSIDTLFSACMMNRLDLLHKMSCIFEEPGWDDKQILTKYYTNEPIEAYETMKINCYNANTRYFRVAPNDYTEEMKTLLQKKVGSTFILTEKFISENNRKKSHIILGFHNSSFPYELRNLDILLPDTSALLNFIQELHQECHEKTKIRLKNRRKN